MMAAGECLFDYLDKWKKLIRIVHLHNVELKADNKYWWVPVHPSHESDGLHYPIEGLLRYLVEEASVTFVFEHTPHGGESQSYIEEGYDWVRRVVNS
jgi:hypothetical protein